MTHLMPPTFVRRDLLKGAGALVVSVAIAGDSRVALAQAVAGAETKPPE